MRIFFAGVFTLLTVFSFAQKADTITEHWPNGQIRSVKIYLNQLEHGSWKTYSGDGVLLSETNYSQGKLNGLRTTFAENGNQLSFEYFKNGLQDSVRYVWYPDGHVKAEENYRNGKQDGLCRTFSPEGRIRSTAFYVNDRPEGNFLRANESGFTEEEGYARNGKWIWYRKFCNNKLCEIRGLDTISGMDSVRQFNPQGYLILKKLNYQRDSFHCSREYHYGENEYLLWKKTEEPQHGFFYLKTWSWEITATDTFLSSFRTDSIRIDEYRKCLSEDGQRCYFSSVEYHYFPSGKIRSEEFPAGEYSRCINYSEDGYFVEEGWMNYYSHMRRGLWLTKYRGEDSVLYTRHSWYEESGNCDTTFYPDGKIRSIGWSGRNGSETDEYYEYSHQGTLIFAQVSNRNNFNLHTEEIFADGSTKLIHDQQTVKGVRRIIHQEFSRDGKLIHDEKQETSRRCFSHSLLIRDSIGNTESRIVHSRLHAHRKTRSRVKLIKTDASGKVIFKASYLIFPDHAAEPQIRRGQKRCYNAAGKCISSEKLGGKTESEAAGNCGNQIRSAN